MCIAVWTQENMINSLRKDSHITQIFRIQEIATPQRRSVSENERRESLNASAKNNTGISIREPAGINFSGLASRTLANDAEFKTLVEAAKKIVGSGKKQYKKVMKLMHDAADFLIPQVPQKDGTIKPQTEVSSTVKSFIEANETSLQFFADRARQLTIKDTESKIRDISGAIIPEELRKETIDSIYYATEALPAVGKDPWYENNPNLNRILALASSNNIAFSALFALILTGIFRPAAIMTLPCDKKNKDDQKYAAAHSIASGVIGFIVSIIISKPLTDGLNKVLDKPEEYIKGKKGHFTLSRADAYKQIKTNEAANIWITRGTDILMAVPKAFITIALIPPILKYIFGYEKKKHANKPINIQTNYNQNSNNEKRPKNIAGGIK